HLDEHPSFSVFQKKDGTWWHKCFVGCSEGDEIAFLVKARNVSTREAIMLYLEMAGFPPSRAPKSHEYPKSPSSRGFPKSHEFHESPDYPVSPVSNGQGLDGEREPLAALERLAARNACTERNTARKRRWKLVRDLRAVEKGIGRQLSNGELMRVF